MILVTGATGNVGKELVPKLLERGERVRVLTRDARKVAHLRGRVDCAVGDLDKPATLEPAFKGIDRLYLVTMANSTHQDATAVTLAKKAGVRHMVKLSTLEALEHKLQVGKWHYAKEQVIRDSGLAWTFLRPGMFMSNALQWADAVKASGKVYFPGGRGKVAPIAPRDVATVAALALTERGHEGKAYELTGAELLTLEEMTAILSHVLGKPLQYVDVPLLAARVFLSRQLGWKMGSALAELAGALKVGKGAVMTDTFEHLTGCSPRSFESWCREHVAAFKA
jgi:(4-alkanoyl-5-oxo-2,5-dihydrofuran-3-yl)methyl phosphate reductase